MLSRTPISRYSEGLGRLRGVEIFAAGTHRGKAYSEADLNEMATNFAAASQPQASGRAPLLRVPAVLGHEENQEFLERSDLPAAAWAERIYVARRVGKDGKPRATLLADFGDVPPKVVRLLKNKAYRTVSAEIYDTPPAGVPGKGKMLRRVAFLGGDIPQVKSLDDIPEPEIHSDPAAYRPVFVTFREARPVAAAGTFWVFSEVSPMNRDAMLKQLQEKGFDTSTVSDTVPDNVLAEMCRVGSQSNDMDDNADLPDPKDDAEKEAYREKARKYRDRAKKFADKCGMKLDDTAAPPVPPKPDPAKPEDAAKMREMEARWARLEKMTEQREQAEKRSLVDARLKTLVQEGRVLPAEIDGGLAELALSQDMTTVRKFTEGGKQVERSAFDHFLATLEKRPKLVHFGERFKDPANPTSPEAEVEKVKEFVARPDIAHALRSAGKTPTEHVEKFTELRKKNPSLTAADYGVS